MAFYGADVTALRDLAASMERAADSLSRSVGSIDGALHHASAWKGPWADRFRSQWTAVDRRKLSGSSSDLRAVARQLRANANAQEQTSAAATGASGAGTVGTGSPASWSAAALGALGLQALTTLHIDPSMLGGPITRSLQGVDPWKVLDAVKGGVSNLDLVGKESSVLNHVIMGARELGDMKGIVHALGTGAVTWRTAFEGVASAAFENRVGGDVDKVLGNAVGAAERAATGTANALKDLRAATKLVGGISGAIGKVSTVISAAELVHKAADGQLTASDVLDTVATGLKSTKSPPLYLTGVVASIASTDAQLLQKTDLSAGTFTNTVKFMQEHPDSIAKGLEAGTVGVAQNLLKWAT